MPRFKRFRIGLLGAAGVASAALLYSAGYVALHLYRSVQLAKASQPFQTAGIAGGPRVLVVGDSTGEGTGASSPEHSLAGLLAQRVPGLAIVNRSRDGARFAEFADQIPTAERFDAILVLGGGNDVIRFTHAAKLQDGVARVANKARSNADIVVFVPPGNVGNAPFFLPPWRSLMSWRATRLHEIVAAVAKRTDSKYVRLYKERDEDPFAQRPERMNAEDGLHPSDAGYAIWMSELAHQTDLITLLSGQRRTS